MDFVKTKLFKNFLMADLPLSVLFIIYTKAISNIITITNINVNLPIKTPVEKDIKNEFCPMDSPPSSFIIFSNIGNIFVTNNAITKDIMANKSVG